MEHFERSFFRHQFQKLLFFHFLFLKDHYLSFLFFDFYSLRFYLDCSSKSHQVFYLHHKEIILPQNAPKEFGDRSTLWNTVKKIKKRKDSQVAREIQVALPKELNIQEQIKLTQSFIKDNFTSKNIIVDFAIHNKGDGNPHAHILTTTRAVNEKGFENKKIEN